MSARVQRGSIDRVLVVVKIGTDQGTRVARSLVEWLERRGVDVLADAETARALGRADGFSRESIPPDADLAIVAGGDGTLLSVARAAAPLSIPLLGVNFGSLGFLTELQPDEIFDGLEAVLAGRYAIEERHTLRVRYAQGPSPPREYAVLNDAVVAKSALARMITIGVTVDGIDVATYTSDGLIVSTATGSTAYNLSAGGPVLDPRMAAFVIAPICPHTMNYRPLVVPGSVSISVALRHADAGQVYATLDGQVGFPFGAEDRLIVDAHPSPARLVRVAERSFFEVLRRKLGWGAR